MCIALLDVADAAELFVDAEGNLRNKSCLSEAPVYSTENFKKFS